MITMHPWFEHTNPKSKQSY